MKKKKKLALNNKGDTLITALISSLVLGIVAIGLIYGFFVSARTNALGDYIERSTLIAQYVMERVSSLPPNSIKVKSTGSYGDYNNPGSNGAINNLITGLTTDVANKFPFYKTGGNINYGIRIDISNPATNLDSNVVPNLRVITVTVEPSLILRKYLYGKKKNVPNIGAIARTLKYVD